MIILESELEVLVEEISSLNTLILKRSENRHLVNEKKFSEPEYVEKEFGNLMEASSIRERCKKQHDKIKHILKDKREQYGDLNVHNIVDKLSARVDQIMRDMADLEAYYNKIEKPT